MLAGALLILQLGACVDGAGSDAKFSSGACLEVRLEARLDPQAGIVTGTLACRRGRPQPLQLALFPRALGSEREMDDVRAPWYYPNGYSAADMKLWAQGAAIEPQGIWASWPAAGPTGAWETVGFRTIIPRRNGPLGREDRIFMLAGGWHPALAVDKSLIPHNIDYRLEVPADYVGLAGTRPIGRATLPQTVTGRHRGHFVPWVMAPQAPVQRTPDAVSWVPGQAPQATDDTVSLPALPHPPMQDSQPKLVQAIAEAAGFARNQGLATRPFLVVIAPLRTQLVEPFEGGLLVSDRIFQLFSHDAFIQSFWAF